MRKHLTVMAEPPAPLIHLPASYGAVQCHQVQPRTVNKPPVGEPSVRAVSLEVVGSGVVSDIL